MLTPTGVTCCQLVLASGTVVVATGASVVTMIVVGVAAAAVVVPTVQSILPTKVALNPELYRMAFPFVNCINLLAPPQGTPEQQFLVPVHVPR